MRKPLISVIVPVYGIENYIEKCITSLIHQTYTNLEIILVDDGSKDSSGAICDSFAASDSRIHVIHKVNGGLSSARNAGIDYAHGDYITFVDGDDFVHCQEIELLYHALVENDADVSICHEQAFFSDEDILDKRYKQYTLEKVESNTEFIYHYMDAFLGPMGWSWNKLYKREVIGDARFVVGRSVENLMFNALVLCNAHRYVWIEQRLYYYFQRSDSLSKDTKKMIEDRAYSEVYLWNTLHKISSADFKEKYAGYCLNKLAIEYSESVLNKYLDVSEIIWSNFVKQYKTCFPMVKSPRYKISVWFARYFRRLYVLMKKFL